MEQEALASECSHVVHQFSRFLLHCKREANTICEQISSFPKCLGFAGRHTQDTQDASSPHPMPTHSKGDTVGSVFDSHPRSGLIGPQVHKECARQRGLHVKKDDARTPPPLPTHNIDGRWTPPPPGQATPIGNWSGSRLSSIYAQATLVTIGSVALLTPSLPGVSRGHQCVVHKLISLIFRATLPIAHALCAHPP